MQYKAREADRDTAALAADLEPVVGGLGFTLVELDLYRTRKSARIRLVVTRPPDAEGAGTGTEDLARLHRAALPRLELALEGRDLFVEVSSPGTDRLVREGAEFRCYTGRQLRCYLSGASAWETGVLRGSDAEKILLETGEGIRELRYEEIAKARLFG